MRFFVILSAFNIIISDYRIVWFNFAITPNVALFTKFLK